jgi:hypothetical protein
MARLVALVDKYKPYYEHCSTARIELAEREGEVKALSRENQLLRREFEQLLLESEELAERVRSLETEKQALVRERHAIEVAPSSPSASIGTSRTPSRSTRQPAGGESRSTCGNWRRLGARLTVPFS